MLLLLLLLFVVVAVIGLWEVVVRFVVFAVVRVVVALLFVMVLVGSFDPPF